MATIGQYINYLNAKQTNHLLADLVHQTMFDLTVSCDQCTNTLAGMRENNPIALHICK